MTANTNSYKPHEVQILTQRLCGCGSDGVLVIVRACCIRVLIYVRSDACDCGGMLHARPNAIVILITGVSRGMPNARPYLCV